MSIIPNNNLPPNSPRNPAPAPAAPEPSEPKDTLVRSSEGVTPLSTTLSGPQFGKFEGCSVSTLLSGQNRSMTEDTEAQTRLGKDLARLIKAGRIKWTEPGQEVGHKELFDERGQPYMGVVRWVDGKPTIERVTIVS